MFYHYCQQYLHCLFLQLYEKISQTKCNPGLAIVILADSNTKIDVEAHNISSTYFNVQFSEKVYDNHKLWREDFMALFIDKYLMRETNYEIINNTNV